ncbi:C-reactive protein-like [Nerophis lumbriciformis]|uniref:C-reactive protein-like n=1 Tax=Nerophis lumbriciformis TaxID=546530 RepID=UPI002ADFE713|nr:C-reactive protein-like [Nerophis lumbriciformis]
MEKLFLITLMLATCSAVPRDLSGKVFVFPKETATDHIKLLTSKTSLNAVTVCLRFLTDLSRNYGLLSLATATHNNDLVLFKSNSQDVMSMHARDSNTDFLAVSLPPNSWHSMCATWNSENGVAQLWVDGKQTVKRFIHSGQPISGDFITILGQEQDSYGGGFDAKQSFIGMISRFHMWDYVIAPEEIYRYMWDVHFTPGNVFNWRALDYQIVGDVLLEQEVLKPRESLTRQ